MIWLALKSLVVWCLILGLALCNAALRELVLVPMLGRVRGLVLSGVLLSLLIGMAAYACLPWLGARRVPELIGIGGVWLVLTMAFDLGMGWVQGKSGTELLAAYLFRDGNLWPIVLLATAGAPYLVARLRGWV